MFYRESLKKAQNNFENKKKEYENIGAKADEYAMKLYEKRKISAKIVSRFQLFLSHISNLPNSFVNSTSAENIINAFHKAVEFEENNANENSNKAGVAGVVTGSAVAAMGAPAAMAVATTFGTASTGAAISSLSGVAATNAAIAWLGGGALAAGGGGISAGSAFLALAGPVGWSIACVSVAGGGLFAYFRNKKATHNILKQCDLIDQHIKILSPKLEKLISISDEIDELNIKTDLLKVVNSYPRDYNKFSIEQKSEFYILQKNINRLVFLINERIN